MSRSTKSFPVLFSLLVLLGLLLPLTQVACSPPQKEAASNVLLSISERVDEALEVPNDLVFAGQVSDIDGLWLNNYVIVLFKNGEEIGRTHTQLHDSPLSGKGPMDGVFELRFTNEYELTTIHDFKLDGTLPLIMTPVNGAMGQAYIGTWFDLIPDSYRVIQVPDKQLTYTLVVLEEPLNELSTIYQPGKLTFDNDNNTLIINQQEEQQNLVIEYVAEAATAVPTPQPQAGIQTVSTSANKPAPQSDVQLVVLPSRNNGQDWHLQLTGYYGNRWDVWETYVVGRGVDMSWETFREAVLIRNPHLEADGFVFYSDKTYLLPYTQ